MEGKFNEEKDKNVIGGIYPHRIKKIIVKAMAM